MGNLKNCDQEKYANQNQIMGLTAYYADILKYGVQINPRPICILKPYYDKCLTGFTRQSAFNYLAKWFISLL